MRRENLNIHRTFRLQIVGGCTWKTEHIRVYYKNDSQVNPFRGSTKKKIK